MGQAKLRGIFEERKARAIKAGRIKVENEHELRPKSDFFVPSGDLLLSILALAMSMGRRRPNHGTPRI